jgi:hypothetical protein
MSTLTQLKYLAAYYVRHHCEPQDFDEIGGEAQFIDDAAYLILDKLPTADLEKIRQFMVAGNVNEWIPLGQAIDEALNPADWSDDEEEKYGYVDRNREMHNYFYGSTGVNEGP